MIRSGLPVAKLIASSLADQIAGLFGLLFIGLGAGPWQRPRASPTRRSITLIVGTLLAIGLADLALATSSRVLRWVLARCPRWLWALSLVDQITAVATAYRAKPRTMMAAVAISMVSQSFALASLYC